MVCGFIYYQDSLFFHLLAVVLVIGVLKLATERYIPEVSERERAKIDQASRERKRGLSMFRAVTGTHARVNLLMLPIFLLYENLGVERYLSLLDLQGNVFEASISLLGIVIGFSTLILGDHLIKGSQGRQKQTYLLRGLVGIALLFLVIAGVAFLALVLQPMAAQLQSDVAQPQLVPQLPGIDQIISSFLFDETVRIRVLIALANEFLLFSIPAALFYLFSVIRDLVERYKEVREQEPDLLGASDIDPQDSRGTTDQL